MKLLNGDVFMKQIGMRIKFLRMHSGLTQDDLAKKIRVFKIFDLKH